MTDSLDHIDRQPHADFDVDKRIRKARKVTTLLARRRPLEGARVLEIGTGSGMLAKLLSDEVGPDGRVVACDIDDMRVVEGDYEFHVVDGVDLPVDDSSFDIVVSNHVMEHVGSDASQVRHLREIGRALTDDGFAYFSVPNRWRLVEPHFRLPFLSWFPQRGSDAYVRLTRKGDYYDVNPPSPAKTERLITEAGLDFDDITYEQMQVMREVEDPGAVASLLLRSPEWAYRATRPIITSLIYILRPRPPA